MNQFSVSTRIIPPYSGEGFGFASLGTQIPPELLIKLRVELRDQALPALEEDDYALPHIVGIKGQTGWVGVADGRYRLSVRRAGTSATSGPSSRIASLLDLDLSGIPDYVELNGDSVEYEIPARLSSEIKLTEPQQHATVDLRTDLFRWSAPENADHYKITFARRENRVGEGRYYTGGGTIRATTNGVCLAVLADDERRKTEWLKHGITVVWQVHAFDRDGQRIGASLEADRSFLVGHGIEDSEQDQ